MPEYIDDFGPEFWSHRVNSPDKYKRMRYEKGKFGAGIDVVWGVPKGEDGVEVQAIRFSKDKFPTKESVSNWLSEHKDVTKKKMEAKLSMVDARNFPQLFSIYGTNGWLE